MLKKEHRDGGTNDEGRREQKMAAIKIISYIIVIKLMLVGEEKLENRVSFSLLCIYILRSEY